MEQIHDFEVLITQDALQRKIEALGRRISRDYQNCEKPLILVAMLKGSLYFLADLSRQINVAHTFDFISIGSYATEKSTTGIIRVDKDISLDIEGHDVLVIEEIVRTGLTTNFMLSHLEAKSPKSIALCSLLVNPDQQLINLPLKYRGFTIDYTRVVGYGMDYKEWGRGLPYIAKLNTDWINSRLKRKE